MDVAMDIAYPEEQGPCMSQSEELYCGNCGEQLGKHSGYHGSLGGYFGRWQKVMTADGITWIYLCKGCDNALWRVFQRLEEWLDEKQRQQEWNRFLLKELKYN